MIRGLRVFFCLLALDVLRTAVHPAHIIYLIIDLVLSPLFMIGIMAMPRESQNEQIVYGCDKAADWARAFYAVEIPPPRGPFFFLWHKLFEMLTEREVAELFGPPPPGLDE